MDKSVSIAKFEEAREYMDGLLVDIISNMDVGIYDPWLKHIFESEVSKLVQYEFKKKYPDVMVKFSFSVYLSAQTIEYSVQHFYHPFSMHKFLGSIRDHSREQGKKEPFLVDCYYSSLYEVFGEPRILVRYGHEKKDVEEGAISVAQEFYRGSDSMLAKAYQLALEAGYVQG